MEGLDEEANWLDGTVPGVWAGRVVELEPGADPTHPGSVYAVGWELCEARTVG